MQRQLRRLGPTTSALMQGPARTWLLLVGAAILPLLLISGSVGYLAAIQTRDEPAIARRRPWTALPAGSRRSWPLNSTSYGRFRSPQPWTRPTWRHSGPRPSGCSNLCGTPIELALPSGPQLLNLLRRSGEPNASERGSVTNPILIRCSRCRRRAKVGGQRPRATFLGHLFKQLFGRRVDFCDRQTQVPADCRSARLKHIS